MRTMSLALLLLLPISCSTSSTSRPAECRQDSDCRSFPSECWMVCGAGTCEFISSVKVCGFDLAGVDWWLPPDDLVVAPDLGPQPDLAPPITCIPPCPAGTHCTQAGCARN